MKIIVPAIPYKWTFPPQIKPVKVLKGLVVEKNHPKTLVVEILRVQVKYDKYGGLKKKRTRLIVHDPEDKCHIGDQVSVRHVPKAITVTKHHTVHEILRQFPAGVFLDQHPEFKPREGKERKSDIKKEKKKKGNDDSPAFKYLNVKGLLTKNKPNNKSNVEDIARKDKPKSQESAMV
eukprot:TRINITY_DN480_c0_g1_i1.p1 TRINITY_DN480_c0_g1~~TRINITY_DN480_c0_g1_i1.p1  ORF type:complete len:199 (-),score=47.32 TRINITY_DN480_c0_g1_i1:32-562(-)